MFKMFISTSAVATVLLFGLVSCSRENKAQDIYRAPAPTINSLNENLSLKDWDGKARKPLDLNDHIDFSPSGADHLNVTSHCEINGQELRASIALRGAPQVPVFAFLPEEVLSVDFAQTPVHCAFEFNLFNALGSNHLFTLIGATLTETRAAEVQLAHEPAGNGVESLLSVDLHQIQDMRIRFRNSTPSTVDLSCADLSFAPLAFDTVAEVAHFDFNMPVFRAGRSADDLAERQWQNCRAIIRSSGLRSGLSALFRLRLIHGPLNVQLTSGHPRQVTGGPALTAMSELIHGKPFLLNEWSISNDSFFPRYMRFAKVNQPIVGQLAFRYGMSGIEKTASQPSWLSLRPADAPVVHEDQNEILVAVPAHATVSVQAQIEPTAGVKCFPLAIAFYPQGPLPFSEVTKSGESLAPMEVQLPNPVILVREVGEGELAAAAIDNGPACSWP